MTTRAGRLIDETRRRLGNIDVVVSIADAPRLGNLADCDDDFFQQQMSTNCQAPQMLVRGCCRYMNAGIVGNFFRTDGRAIVSGRL